MARRLLLTALVAVLAVALPAAADGDSTSSLGSEPTGPPACSPPEAFCLPVAEETWSQAVAPTLGGLFPAFDGDSGGPSCRVFDFSNDADPMHTIDPDGCWWRFIRRTLGIGMETTLSVGSWTANWTADRLPLPFP